MSLFVYCVGLVVCVGILALFRLQIFGPISDHRTFVEGIGYGLVYRGLWTLFVGGV